MTIDASAPVQTVMSRATITCRPEAVMLAMTKNHIGCIPIAGAGCTCSDVLG